jgi:hypothetical protein
MSFMVGMQSKETLLRLNVYLESGTIGCCTVLNDQVREAFRRNVSSTDNLAKVLANPPKLAQLDESLTGSDADSRDLTARIELAEVGVCILVGEREKLQAHLRAIEAADDEDESDSDGLSEDDNTMAGLEFDYSLHEDVLIQTDQCLEDIAALGKTIHCVSTNGKACIFLYGNGGVAYTTNIPKQLYNKLKSLKNNPKATRPSYVAIGTRDRYYVSFLNGSFDYRGPKAFGQALKKLRAPPRCIAFGPSYDTYFVVFHDGSWEYQGKSLPKDLIAKLKERSERPDLVCVTLGPKGEWFLRTENGRLWWGGIGEDLDDLIQSLLESDRYLNFLDFGEDGSYFVSYD